MEVHYIENQLILVRTTKLLAPVVLLTRRGKLMASENFFIVAPIDAR
jgi:hypothetical protein